MKMRIKIERERETLVLVSGITYAVVPAWYGVTFEDLKMDLILPKRRKESTPRPVVIWMCGGAFGVMDRSVWLPELTEFARCGYAVASVQYRTSNEGPFPMALKDVKAAVRFLRANAEKFGLDPRYIAAAGESAGGSLAALMGVTGGAEEFEEGAFPEYDSRVQAVVDFYGMTDMGAVLEDQPSKIPAWMMEAYLDGDDRYAQEQRASVLTYLAESSPPFLILHGDNDDVVAKAQSEWLYEALIQYGVYADYYLIEEADHGDDMFYQKSVIQIVVNFLNHVMREGEKD